MNAMASASGDRNLGVHVLCRVVIDTYLYSYGHVFVNNILLIYHYHSPIVKYIVNVIIF